MLKISLVLLSLVVFLVEGCTYRNRECPNYSILAKHPDYEIRKYSAITWVSTTAEHSYFKIAASRAFTKLAGYINGKNNLKLKINMTIPVRMHATYKEQSTVYQMDFKVPNKYAAAPPLPTEEGITFIYDEPTVYAVRKFTGYAWHEETWIEESEKLAESLKNDATIDKTTYYQVKYDKPDTIVNRRNEIWMKKITT
ncbi:heme-binding protein 2 [Parasteatoda tepidariorum]|uniref:heme-binding protein 2 n=1 Tax=Parasteatoda tepidariorum TaxID=114398 RepID=UPI001C71EA94|nr:heme-binding protein 2-like [Parasteatoda tepidariorum]